MFKNRVEYTLVFIYTLLYFLFFHNFFFFYLFLIVVALPFISFFVSRNIWKKSGAEISAPLTVIYGSGDMGVDFVTENSSRLPIPGIFLRFIAENAYYPNEEIQEMKLPLKTGRNSYRWNIQSVYSGRIVIKGIEVSMPDYLGLFVFKKEWPAQAAVSVIPPKDDIVMDIIENSFIQGEEQEANSTNSTEDVTRIKQFREYVPGDRMQRVNWKISAKHDTLYVKEYERLFNRTLTLLVELRRDSDSIGFLDELITAFYSAGEKLLEMEMPFRVCWYDCETNRFITENVDDNESFIEVLEQMYLMQSYTEYYAYEKYNEAGLGVNDRAVYFTSPSFEGADKHTLLGAYKESVVLICL